MLAVSFFAIGLVLIIEGLAYALAPSLIENMLKMLADTPEQARRIIGALCVVVGLILLWIAHLFGLSIQF